jgi:hypothetical protein
MNFELPPGRFGWIVLGGVLVGSAVAAGAAAGASKILDKNNRESQK